MAVIDNSVFDNPLFIQIRDTDVALTETNLVVVNGRTVTNEIPRRTDGVIITDGGVQLTEIRDASHVLGNLEFRVDYKIGWIYFNNTYYPDGTALDGISYRGRGVILYPIERLTTASGGTIGEGIVKVYDNDLLINSQVGKINFGANVNVANDPTDINKIIVTIDRGLETLVAMDLSNDIVYIPLLADDADGSEVGYIYDIANETTHKMTLDEIKLYSVKDVVANITEINDVTIPEVNNKIGANESDIDDLETEQSLQADRITVNEADIVTIESDIATIETKNSAQDVKITDNQLEIKSITESLSKISNDDIVEEVNGEEIIDLPTNTASGSPLRFRLDGLTEGINKVAYVNKTIDEIVYETLTYRDIYEGLDYPTEQPISSLFSTQPTQQNLDDWFVIFTAREGITKKVLTYKDVFETNNLITNPYFDVDGSWAVTGQTSYNVLKGYMEIVNADTIMSRIYQTGFEDIQGQDTYVSADLKTNSETGLFGLTYTDPEQMPSEITSSSWKQYSDILVGSNPSNVIQIRMTGAVIGSMFSIDNVFLLNLNIFDEDIDKATLDALLVYYKKYRAWLLDGVKFNKRLKSVGQNQIDISKYNRDLTGLASTGICQPMGEKLKIGRIRHNGFISGLEMFLQPNTEYRFTFSVEGYSAEGGGSMYIYKDAFYGNSLATNSIGGNGNFQTVFTTDDTGKALFGFYFGGESDSGDEYTVYNMMLTAGNTYPSYIPYTETFKYILANKEGSKLPNGVKDTIEYRDGKYYHIQRVGEHILVDADVNNYYTAPAITTYIFITKPLDYVDATYNGWSSEENIILETYNIHTTGASDIIENTGSVHASQIVNFILIVKKEKYASLVAARADLVGIKLFYELAQPIETEIQVFGNILGHSNGTVYVESVMQDVALYNSKLDVPNVDYPIESLETIEVVGADGFITKLDVSDAVVASDGLSFTHPSLAVNDMVYFTYYYSDSNPFGNTIITYMNSKYVLPNQDSSRFYKKVETVDDSSGTPEPVYTYVEVI